MVKSMTAYACAQARSEHWQIQWELKSLNNRYLDIQMRLPDALSHFEMAARELIQARLGRGKIEASCRYQSISNESEKLKLNANKISAVIASCNEIEMQMGPCKTFSALDILKFPGVIEQQSETVSAEESLLLKALGDSLEQLQQSREAEGKRLCEMILQRADTTAKIVQTIRQRRPAVVLAVQNKLQQRLQDLLENTEHERFEQELVSIAQKIDVDEELDRLDSHLQELKDVFRREEAIGRRLDFLMQELNREANTLASKAADVETTQAALSLKVLIEQMREQIQNIE
ncbi:MAG: YicC family protein [Gammaproteobacteria bacterium]|nr:YicC family protein [Gammaproteobacteria bacterium]